MPNLSDDSKENKCPDDTSTLIQDAKDLLERSVIKRNRSLRGNSKSCRPIILQRRNSFGSSSIPFVKKDSSYIGKDFHSKTFVKNSKRLQNSTSQKDVTSCVGKAKALSICQKIGPLKTNKQHSAKGTSLTQINESKKSISYKKMHKKRLSQKRKKSSEKKKLSGRGTPQKIAPHSTFHIFPPQMFSQFHQSNLSGKDFFHSPPILPKGHQAAALNQNQPEGFCGECNAV